MENLVYFIAILKELPKGCFDNNIFKFQDTKYVYSFLGVTQEDYTKYIAGAPHDVLDGQMVVDGCKWWGEIRSQKKHYAKDEELGGETLKVYISMTDTIAANTVALMKIFAAKIINREIEKGTPGYNKTVFDLFDKATTIRELNILYEDYIGVPMPDSQAREMKLFTANGQRIYNENRLTIENFKRKVLPILPVRE